MSPDDEVHFRPTSGRAMGVGAVVLALTVVVIAVVDPGGVPAPVACVFALGGVLAWASMLWPALWVDREHLHVRGMFEQVRLPLAAIEELAVRQVLAVRAGDKRYVSSVVGRSWRKNMAADRRTRRGVEEPERPVTEMAYADYVETEVRDRMEAARAAAGVGLLSDEQLTLAEGVRREPQWLPIGLVAVAVAALVVSLLV